MERWVSGRTRLELNGTDNSDVFDVNFPADQIQIFDQASSLVTVALNTGGINALELRGLNGDDTFNLFGRLPYLGGTLVNGGDPSGSDIVNLSGATGSVTVNLADSTLPRRPTRLRLPAMAARSP